jgi:hypothetical protein
MKSFNMKKNYFFLLLLTVISVQLSAQEEFRTDESISKQLKNNKQPGMKYAPATQPAASPSKGFTGSSLAKAIREGKYGQVQQGSASAPVKKVSNAGASNAASLPSNKSAAEVEKELKASKAKIPAPPPMQEEKSEAPAKGKTAPVKKAGQ